MVSQSILLRTSVLKFLYKSFTLKQQDHDKLKGRLVTVLLCHSDYLTNLIFRMTLGVENS